MVRPAAQEVPRTAPGFTRPNAPAPLTPRAALPIDPAAATALAARIDAHLAAGWRDAGLTPAAPADDATWLRRLSLDLRGLIPTATEVAAFLADADPGKRERTIDAWLDQPDFARHLSYVWCNVLFSAAPRERVRTEALLRPWLEQQFRARVPFATIVEGTVAGTEWSRFTTCTSFVLTYQDSLELLAGAVARSYLGLQIQCAQCHDHKFDDWTQAQFNRFAGFFIDVRADHTGGPNGSTLFRIVDQSPEWEFQEQLNKIVVQARRGASAMAAERRAAPMAGEADDGQVFEEDILGTRQRASDAMAGRSAASELQLAALEELLLAAKRTRKRDNALATFEADPARMAALLQTLPTEARELVLLYQSRRAAFTTAGFLDDTPWQDDGATPRRKALADWIVAPGNRWHGRSVANRVVAQLLGRGLIEPVDDLTGGSDRVLPELLDLLATAFVAKEGDLRLLYGALCRSRAYALGQCAADVSAADRAQAERCFAAQPVAPLSAEQMLYSLVRATTADGTAELLQTTATEFRTEQTRKVKIDQLKSSCTVDLPTGAAEYQPTIPAALFLINGDMTARAAPLASDPELAPLFDEAQAPPAAAIDALFRRTLSRPAAPAEQTAFAASLADPAVPRSRAIEDALWALLNATEFHVRR